MIKKIIISLIFFTTLQANAFEDYIISTNGKLSNILIENNEIVDICPIITIANDKNILMVHPLKEGITCFTVVKNNKEKFLFNIKITEDKTTILPIKGFDILSLDIPPIEEDLDMLLDLPPEIEKIEENKFEWLDPPVLREEN